MIPWGLIIRFGLPAIGILGALAAFNLWLGGVKREAYDRGKQDTVQALAEETERLKSEHAKEAEALRSTILEREREFAKDIADITRQALSGAAPDRVAIDNDTRRMLNARTARSNTDIEEAAGGVNADLPLASIEEP